MYEPWVWVNTVLWCYFPTNEHLGAVRCFMRNLAVEYAFGIVNSFSFRVKYNSLVTLEWFLDSNIQQSVHTDSNLFGFLFY